jgi:hypothetical protein
MEPVMSLPTSAAAVLDREFLAIRAKLIEIAAALDRVDRGEGSVADDARLDQIRRSLEILAGSHPNRAERIQMLFSLPYDEHWTSRFGINP